MKRNLTLYFIIFLMLTLSVSCSKMKKNKQKASEQTIDLAEVEVQDEEVAEAVAEEEPAENRNSAAEIEKRSARRNLEAARNPDGSGRRGIPAAAQQAADADGEGAEGNYDFSDRPEGSRQRGRLMDRGKPGSEFSIAHLLELKEIRETINYAGVAEQADLGGQEIDGRYNAMRWVTENPKDLGISLQVWKPGNEFAASKQFNDLFAQSFAGTKLKGLGTDAYFSEHHNIREIYFYVSTKRSVASLACTQKLCTKDQMLTLARIIEKRL